MSQIFPAAEDACYQAELKRQAAVYNVPVRALVRRVVRLHLDGGIRDHALLDGLVAVIDRYGIPWVLVRAADGNSLWRRVGSAGRDATILGSELASGRGGLIPVTYTEAMEVEQRFDPL